MFVGGARESCPSRNNDHIDGGSLKNRIKEVQRPSLGSRGIDNDSVLLWDRGIRLYGKRDRQTDREREK